MNSQLFARIPPEVWEIIFQYIERDPYSLYNCCNVLALGAWNDVLSEKITTFLFPLVLPSLREELSTKDILTLGGVCKTWKSAVDSLIEEMSPYYPVPSEAIYRHSHSAQTEWFGEKKLGTTFKRTLEIEKFMGEMKMIKGNPFINNTVKLLPNYSYRDTDKNRMLYQKFTNLIENFGHHVLTCVYIANGSTVSYNEMQYLFKHLPNLRCLAIAFEYDWMSVKMEKEDEELGRSLNWLRDPDLLPSLPHLKSLNLFSDNELLCDSLLKRYGRQLHSLSRSFEVFKTESIFKCLQSRALEYLRAFKIDGYVCDFGFLERIFGLHMPHLERLHLIRSKSDANTLKTLIRVINKFSSTLVELRWPFYLFDVVKGEMFLRNICKETDFQHDLSIQLPHVKWMSIPYSYTTGFNISDKFLDKFPKLEHLHVMNFDDEYSSRSLEREELFGLTDNLLRRSPSLKNITLEEGTTNKLIFHSTRLRYKYRKMRAMTRLAPLHPITNNDADVDDGGEDENNGDVVFNDELE